MSTFTNWKYIFITYCIRVFLVSSAVSLRYTFIRDLKQTDFTDTSKDHSRTIWASIWDPPKDWAGDAEQGKPGRELLRTICARSISVWRRQGGALWIDRHGVNSRRRLRLPAISPESEIFCHYCCQSQDKLAELEALLAYSYRDRSNNHGDRRGPVPSTCWPWEAGSLGPPSVDKALT